jgi:predicted DNA-binding WGR domain protein
MPSVELLKVIPAENCYRRYRVSERALLCGGFELILEWGRIGARTRLKSQVFQTMAELQTRRQEVLAIRMRHGYSQLTKITCEPAGPETLSITSCGGHGDEAAWPLAVGSPRQSPGSTAASSIP